MSARPNDFKIGLFALGAVVLLVAALFIFGASKFFEGKSVEETYVAGSVEGLKVGAPVLLRGVPVGEVTAINFSWNVYHVQEPRYVVVEFEVGNRVSLVPLGPDYVERVRKEVAKGLRARIKSQGLAGATILSLEYVDDPSASPPLPTPWTPRHVYIPSVPGQFSQIIASLETIAGHLKEVPFQQLGAQVQQDLAAVETLLHHFNHVDVTGLSSNANALVTDVRQVTGRLQAFVGQTNAPAGTNLQTIAARADHLLAALAATTANLDRLVARLDERSLNESLENIRRASKELEQAVRRFRQYPSGALFGSPPPPARSVERPNR